MDVLPTKSCSVKHHKPVKASVCVRAYVIEKGTIGPAGSGSLGTHSLHVMSKNERGPKAASVYGQNVLLSNREDGSLNQST